MKKILLSLGALASACAPIVAVISCSSDDTNAAAPQTNAGTSGTPARRAPLTSTFSMPKALSTVWHKAFQEGPPIVGDIFRAEVNGVMYSHTVNADDVRVIKALGMHAVPVANKVAELIASEGPITKDEVFLSFNMPEGVHANHHWINPVPPSPAGTSITTTTSQGSAGTSSTTITSGAGGSTITTTTVAGTGTNASQGRISITVDLGLSTTNSANGFNNGQISLTNIIAAIRANADFGSLTKMITLVVDGNRLSLALMTGSTDADIKQAINFALTSSASFAPCFDMAH